MGDGEQGEGSNWEAAMFAAHHKLDNLVAIIDRGETWESCLEEIRNLPNVKKYGNDVKVSMYEYERPSYTGCVYPIECYFPTWVIPEDHKVTKALEEAYKGMYGEERIGSSETAAERKARPLTDKWTFSTNGVSIMGRNGIPRYYHGGDGPTLFKYRWLSSREKYCYSRIW